jgi:hypothetical protein
MGIGLRHVEQGCQKVSTATAHPARQPPRKNDVTAKSSGPKSQQESVLRPIRTFEDVPHEVGQWIPSLREFLTDSECTIEIANTQSATGGSTTESSWRTQ